MKRAVATLTAIALASGLALATVPAATAATNARGTIRALTAEYSPYYGLNTFYSIQGVKLVGARHYHVTCTVAQVSAFWQDYLDINTKNSLVADGFKTVTVDLWNDASGRPVKITVTGKSDDTRVYLRVALSHYNQKLTIKAPA